MAVLRVRRPSPSASRQGHRELLFQGKRLPVGSEIDTNDFPRVGKLPGKWAQLIRLGFFHDDHLTDPDITRELRKQRDEFGDAPLVDARPEPEVPIDFDALGNRVLGESDIAALEKPIALQCGECGKQMKNAHGLAIHTSRSHKKE